jgi:hypothetical protein
MSRTKRRVMVYSLKFYEKYKVDDIFLDVLRRTDGLWYTPRMAQKNTKGMTYSSNVSHKNKVMINSSNVSDKSRSMIYSSNVSDKNTGYGILLACLRQKQGV